MRQIIAMRASAEEGDVRAQTEMGISYAHGQGVKKDATEAVKWFRKAALQGFAQAQFNLGVCYAFGEGVEEDEKKALLWFNKAAE